MSEFPPAFEPLPASQPLVGFTVHPIGILRFTASRRTRLPRYFTPRRRADLELFHPFQAGLVGLCEGMDIWVLTLHAGSDHAPHTLGPGPEEPSGVFATQSRHRPNPIEFLRARVVLVDLERGRLTVTGLEAEDGAPLLDIRPVASPHRALA